MTPIRIVLFAALIAVLGVPASFLTARARQQEQQEGPTKPSPSQQPGAAPKAPTGQQQPAQAAAPQAAAPQAPAAAQPASMIDQLNQLAALHQQGALTDAEFAAAKAQLLGT